MRGTKGVFPATRFQIRCNLFDVLASDHNLKSRVDLGLLLQDFPTAIQRIESL